VPYCLRPSAPGRVMVEQLLPSADDYIVLKPKHSAFFATPLDTLLEYIGVKSLIVAGLTTNACVMITASDAYVRDFRLLVPGDCVAALTPQEQHDSLQFMKRNFAADLTSSDDIDFAELLA
jgi:nicotinamidase-related amidase